LRSALAEDSPFLLFFASVMVSAAYGGLGPGLLATLLAGIASNYFLTPPFYRFTLSTRSEIVGLILFVVEGSVISVISDRLHRAVRESRRLERRVLEVADSERARIGRDLHDGLGQQLLGAALLAKSAEARLAENGSTMPLAEDVRNVQRVVGDALSWTRNLARQLASTTVANDGLFPALQDLATNAERLFSIRCVASADPGLASPPPPVCEHLYRIAQEAINNAVKHGHASHIDILWQMRIGRQVLRIRDNGRGFDESERVNSARQAAIDQPAGETREARGIGLRVMRHRAQMVGGHLQIARGDSGGTIVACEFSA